MNDQSSESQVRGLPSLDLLATDVFETATFAMGCFWGPDEMFGALPGVLRTRVGYAGGTSEHPVYQNLDGHAESIQIDFDPEALSYADLLAIFWASHDPTWQPYYPQYRSMIFAHDAEQLAAAQRSLEGQRELLEQPPLTEIVDFVGFTAAEEYHQKFVLQNHRPILEELRPRFDSFEAFVDSTAVARINGYLAGWGSREELEEVIPLLGLSASANETLRISVRDRAFPSCAVPL